jgi:hypothetical protein
MRRLGTAALGLALTLTLAAAAHADSFDARRAADIATALTSHGASGSLKKSDNGHIYFDGQAGELYFDVHFQDCDDARTLCKTLVLGGSWNTKDLTADQINRWNRWTLYCPAYLETDGTPLIWYSVAVSNHTDAGDLADVVSTWMGCLKDFDSFIGAPDDFLKRNTTGDAGPAPPPAAPPHG